FVEHAGLHSPSAAYAPGRHTHLLDYLRFDVVARTQAFGVAAEETVEALGGLIAEDDPLGEEAVLDCVLRGNLFPLGGFRATGASPVGARGINLFLRDTHTPFQSQYRPGNFRPRSLAGKSIVFLEKFL